MHKIIPPRITPSRDDFYMGEALFKAGKSKDPNTQVGAVIVGINNNPLGSGYNGPPRKINDHSISWVREGDLTKYPFIFHAERNAIKRSKRRDLVGSTLYVTGKPCKACMLDIVDAEIATVVYLDIKVDPNSTLAKANNEWHSVEEIARLGGVTLKEFKGNLNWMRDWMIQLESRGVFSN